MQNNEHGTICAILFDDKFHLPSKMLEGMKQVNYKTKQTLFDRTLPAIVT